MSHTKTQTWYAFVYNYSVWGLFPAFNSPKLNKLRRYALDRDIKVIGAILFQAATHIGSSHKGHNLTIYNILVGSALKTHTELHVCQSFVNESLKHICTSFFTLQVLLTICNCRTVRLLASPVSPGDISAVLRLVNPAMSFLSLLSAIITIVTLSCQVKIE